MIKIREIIKEHNKDALFLEEKFDAALIGTGRYCGGKTVAVYDSSKCLEILVDNEEMDELEALEQLERTVDDVKPGKNKPIFVNDFRNMKDLPELETEGKNTLEDLLDQLNL